MTASPSPAFIIKVCGLTTVQDATDAVRAGATAVGLNFYERSPRFISVQLAREIAGALPGNVLRVGVFVNPSSGKLAEIAQSVELDVLQIHGSVDGLPPVNFPVWRAVSVGDDFTPESLDALSCQAFLLDSPTAQYGGSGKTFNWSRVTNVPHRVVLAGGLEPGNVAAAIETARPWGVDACSRLESAPGKKDGRKVREFVRNAALAYEALATSSASIRQEP